MKRLTEQYNGEWVTEHAEEMDYFLIKGKAIDRLAAYEDSGLSPEEVQELAKAKADGRLVVLPCKVGDAVYFIQSICEYKHCDTHTRMSCCGCADYAKNKYVTLSRSFALSDYSDIGKTVFLSREAAEKALGSETERGKEG